MRNSSLFPRQVFARTLGVIIQRAIRLGLLIAVLLTQYAPQRLSAADSPSVLDKRESVAVTDTLRPPPIAINQVDSALPVDDNTLALFHFDTSTGNSTPGAPGNYAGILVNNATIGSGLYDNALHVDGSSGPGSYVKVDSAGTLRQGLSQGTIEAYVDFQTACNGQTSFTIISVGGDFGSNIEGARLRTIGGFLNFEIYATDGWHVASSGINVCRYLVNQSAAVWPYDGTVTFHHVAGTWGPRGMEIWVDGVLHGITYPNYDPNNFIANNGYNCNPQLQIGQVVPWIPNPYYPYCPWNSPQMGNISYPGVYTGGIPANTNLLIGCDPVQFNPPDPLGNITNRCFAGIIDDVRISNIQRTFTVDVTPRWYPTSKTSAEYTKDGYTLALYHLNSVYSPNYILDETHLYDGMLSGNARVVGNGHYSGGLFVDGSKSYAFATLPNLSYGTVETWTKLQSTSKPFSILSMGDQPGGTTSYMMLGMPNWNSTLQVGVFDGTNLQWSDSGMTASSLAGCWHHVAGTWGIFGVEIWVDGVKKGSNSYTGGLHSTGNLVMGCDGWSECMSGYIDEVRVSTVQRTFAPPNVLSLARPAGPAASSAGNFFYFFPFLNTVSVSPPVVCPWG